MKSKQYSEALRTQLQKSLIVLNQSFESDFRLEEKEFKDPTGTLLYGLMLTQMLKEGEKRIWFRTYPTTGSKNNMMAQAYTELFDVIIASFLAQASRADSRTLEALSNNKN